MTSYITQEQYKKLMDNLEKEFGDLRENSTEITLSISSFSDKEKELMIEKVKITVDKILNSRISNE